MTPAVSELGKQNFFGEGRKWLLNSQMYLLNIVKTAVFHP